jgi:hypothetical protein
MVRGLRTVERDLAQAEQIANAPNLGPSYDNDGNVAYTADQLRSMYRRRAEHLREERRSLRRVLGLPEEEETTP